LYFPECVFIYLHFDKNGVVLDLRDFGNTGIKVSALGFGAGEIGDLAVPDKQVETILNTALDYGINLIDTARGYFASEERIGKFIGHRREEYVLSTKVGYGVEGHEDWSYESVSIGIDEALKKMNTDYIDIVHLHSCNVEQLDSGYATDALLKAVEEGKVRISAYAGDNAPLGFAIECGKFRSIITSLNVFDQRIISNNLSRAKDNSMGVIAKRPVGNAPWRFKDRPEGHYCETYWDRMKAMRLDFGKNWQEIALRFSAYIWGVDSCIVGTTKVEHLKANVDIMNKGKLDDEIINNIRKVFRDNDDNWIAQV
jgi:aryl-alcohol dehydrogenase-like predicted oxidoreductase